MKVIKNDNGFEIKVRDANLYKRVFIYNVLIHFIIMVILVISFAYLVSGDLLNKNIYILISVATASLFFVSLISISSHNFYLVSLIVNNDSFFAIYYQMNKKVQVTRNILEIQFKITKYASGRMSLINRIEISDGKKRIFEIRPHSAVIYREYTEEDIEEIYNLLIEHQNKLKQQETTV